MVNLSSECLELWIAVIDVWLYQRDDPGQAAETAVWCTLMSEPTGGEKRVNTIYIYHWVHVYAYTNRGARVTVAVFVAEVPQVDG